MPRSVLGWGRGPCRTKVLGQERAQAHWACLRPTCAYSSQAPARIFRCRTRASRSSCSEIRPCQRGRALRNVDSVCRFSQGANPNLGNHVTSSGFICCSVFSRSRHSLRVPLGRSRLCRFSCHVHFAQTPYLECFAIAILLKLLPAQSTNSDCLLVDLVRESARMYLGQYSRQRKVLEPARRWSS